MDYSKKRFSFDKPIVNQQLIIDKLSQLIIENELNKLCLYKMLSDLSCKDISKANLQYYQYQIESSKFCVLQDILQIRGAYGYTGHVNGMNDMDINYHKFVKWIGQIK